MPASVDHISITSGTFSPEPGVTFKLARFTATLIPQGPTAPLCYAKTTIVSRADIFVDNASLTQLFNEKLEEGSGKIKDLKVTNGLDSVTLSGKIVKLIPIEFSIAGTVSTDGTQILMHAEKIKADGIPIKLLLEAVGQHLSSVLGLKGVNGIKVEDNTLSFDPEQVAHLKGHITAIESTNEGLALHFGPKSRAGSRPAAKPSQPTPASPSEVPPASKK